MTRPALLAALLALTACAAPELATPSDRPTRASAVSIDATAQRLAYAPTGALIEVDGAWGNALTAYQTARAVNARGQCLTIKPGGTVISAGVILARQTACFAVADHNAPLFGLHRYSDPGYWDRGNLEILFGPQGYDAPGCLDWYLRQPEAAGNRIAFVSWAMLEGNCR